MPKNITGGKRAKSMARKNINGSTKNPAGRLRVPKEECERIAVVTKMYGNGMFAAALAEGEDLMGHIRGRHTGRSKRDNFVRVGAIVLVGLREWESEAKNCDLLEVYNESEIDQLSGLVDISFAVGKSSYDTDDVRFVAEVDADDEDNEENNKQVSKLVGALSIDETKISFDDI
jgi:initiation factor 1A